ncbi:hypothetical protein ACLB2K_004196 [Fragaria x ananassa]
MAETVLKMVRDMSKARDLGADIVEIRLDYLKVFNSNQDLKTLIKESPMPTLFTYSFDAWLSTVIKSHACTSITLLIHLTVQYGMFSANKSVSIEVGGQYDGDEKHRLDVLRLAMELGADYIDVEFQAAHEFIDSIDRKKPEKLKVIVSSHNYQDTPSVEDLGELVARIQATGAEIVRITTTALDITDVARIFQISVHSHVPVIGLAMGERGLISRILCAKFGGYFTSGTLHSGIVSVPGEPAIKDILDVYNFRLIRHCTKMFGVIGKPISHSRSPLLYNEVFKSVGFDGVYLHLLVDDIANFLHTYSSTDFSGFSVGIPHKEDALKCCDVVDPIAKSIGAVNCIVRRPTDGKLFGLNTDYFGSISAIEYGLRGSHDKSNIIGSPLAGRLFVIMGAGGAGKALAYGAKQKGARIIIANRKYDRARKLADEVGGDSLSFADLANFRPEDGAILAYSTSVGMQPNIDETRIPKVC